MGTALRILAGLAFCGTCAGSLPAADTAPPELHKLHALFLIDSQAESVGKAVTVDGKRMEVLLRGGVPKDRLALTVLTENDVTNEKIVEYYKGLKSGPGDALLCFYSGHGATDTEHGHYLSLQNSGPFMRSQLRDLMYAHKPGLAVILTDCCSVRMRVDVKRSILEMPGSARQLDPALNALFFRHRGLVDITAATGNGAWCNDEVGGLFTFNLVKVIDRHSKLTAGGREQFVTWKELFPQVQQETVGMSSEWHQEDPQKEDENKQKFQKPQAFELPDDPTRPYLVLHNTAQAVVRYRYRWGNEGNWASASLPPEGDRLHSVPATIASPERSNLELKFEDGETDTLKVGKRYRYSPGPKKTRGLDEDAAFP